MTEPSHHPLPLTLDEITPAWLTAALRTRAPGVGVRAFEIVDINHGTSTKVRLRLDVDEAGRRAGLPETVILKGGFEPHSWYDIHEMETRWYRDVLPAQPLRAPICYFADCDAERGQGIIVMEDLVPRGVRFCSALAPERFDDVARRLGVLAEYHARTYASPELDPGGRWGWVRKMLEKAAGAMAAYSPDVWRGWVASPQGAAVSAHFQDYDWMAQALQRCYALSETTPHALLHGDTHPGNLYVDVDGEPGFLDSMVHRGPPMLEVAYHLSCTLDSGDRARWEGALIQHYLTELRRHGADAPSLDEALDQYAVFLAFGCWVFIINETVWQPAAVNTAYSARISLAMIDHDTKGSLARLAV
jgi:hypothetical protein